MNGNELFSMLMYLTGATAFGLLGLAVIGGFVDVHKHFRKWMLALIFPIILLAIAGGSLLSGRNVVSAEADVAVAVAVQTTTPATVTWFLRCATALVLGICIARLISVSQRYENRGKEGRGLYFAFLFYYLTNVVLNNMFGTQPFFDQKFLYPLLLFTTLYFSRNQDRYLSTEAMKWGLLIFMLGSAIVAFALPTISVQHDYAGYLPGTDIRFWGLASNPNSIGPLAVVFLLLLAHSSFRKRWLQYLAVTVTVAILLLSQSKTAWIASVVSFVFLWWGKLKYAPTTLAKRYRTPYALRHFAGPLLISSSVILMIAAYAIFSLYETQFAAIDNEQQITTLTGRTAIWEVAIETWKNSPVFGYGSSIWGPDFRTSIGMNFAMTAHSQFLQALSEAGTVGFIGLIVYLLTLWACAYRANKETQGLSFALFVFILVRAFTETPFDMSAIMSAEFLTHLLLFRLVLLKSRAREAVPYAQAHRQLQWG